MTNGYIIIDLAEVTTEPKVIKGMYRKVTCGKPIAFNEWTYLTNKGIASFGTGSFKEVGGLVTCVLGIIGTGRVLLTVDIDDTTQLVFEPFKSAVMSTVPKQTKPLDKPTTAENTEIIVDIPTVEAPIEETTEKVVE